VRAAAGLLVAVLLLTACGQQPDRLGSEEPGAVAAAQPCPEALDRDAPVPAQPAAALSAQLAPDEVPQAVLVCQYGDAQGRGTAALEGARELSGGLDALPGDLAVPAGTDSGPCTAMGGPLVPYLVQLRYAEQVVWLRTHDEVNGCALVTNGAFTSGTYLGGQVAASYDAGAWVEAPSRRVGGPTSDCPAGPSARAGQEQELVPAGWNEVVVCRSSQAGSTATTLPAGGRTTWSRC
jgi:hypothetical protein